METKFPVLLTSEMPVTGGTGTGKKKCKKLMDKILHLPGSIQYVFSDWQTKIMSISGIDRRFALTPSPLSRVRV